MLKYASNINLRWKEYDDEDFIRWVAEFPVTKITPLGPAVIDGTQICCELHQQLPDGTWRSAHVPYHWIKYGGIASIEVRKCGLVELDEKFLRRLQARDAFASKVDGRPVGQLMKCGCCGNHLYNYGAEVPLGYTPVRT